VEVFTTDQNGDGTLEVRTDRVEMLDGVSVRYFRSGWPRRLARAPGMAKELRERIDGFDTIHLHGLFLWPADAAARAAERAGVPWVVSPRGMLVDELITARGCGRKRLWLATAGRRTLGRARRLIATSALEAEQAAATGVAIPAIEILANGVEQPTPPRPEELDDEIATFLSTGPTFVYLGRLSWKKGLERLIRAVAMTPEAQLILAGNDDENIWPALDDLARRSGAARRVLRAGFVDGAAKSALLAGARALVLPSVSENFGNVVLEAWSLSTPVIVAPGVGLATEVIAAEAGLVEDGSVEGLATALERMRVGKAEARAMGARGHQRVDKDFAWSGIALRAEQIYQRVSEENGR